MVQARTGETSESGEATGMDTCIYTLSDLGEAKLPNPRMQLRYLMHNILGEVKHPSQVTQLELIPIVCTLSGEVETSESQDAT